MAIRALLLTDVVDSTRLAEQLGDVAMSALWARHDRIARDLLPLHAGREIDKTDGFLLLFERAHDAVAYAVAYHRALGELGIAARAGLHVGSVILTQNDPWDVARGAKPLEVDGLAKPTAARVMSVAAAGQTLLTRDAVDALQPTSLRVKSHGRWRLKGVAEPIELFEVGDELAPMTPPPDGAKVYRVVERGGVWVPVRDVPCSLPAERDAFVGRAADLRALVDLFERSRLVSLLGTGGTGKTRLATRFAWTWLGDFPGGAFFCDLSEARSCDGVVQAVAAALDVPLGKDDAVVQLGHAIAGRGECLIVLDNFEQVAREAPRTVGKWLDRARDARFLVTTREVLGLPGEAALALAPLVDDDAVDLFVARARQAKPDFAPDDDASIRALVDLLDRLPLAIELAAARVRVMPPRALLDRMSQRFKLLASSGGRHTRQATLRATFDWGWDLLADDERAALAQLSVFEGGFTLEAAEAVLALSDLWPTDAVQALVDRSWVRRVGHDRFDVLVSVQEYASERLDASARLAAEIRHGAWFARFSAEDQREALHMHGGVERLAALRRDLDNVVVACRRAAGRGDAPVATATALAAGDLLELSGPLATMVELVESAIALGPRPEDRARLDRALATALRMLGRGADAVALNEQALRWARSTGDRRLEGMILGNLATHAASLGRWDDALALHAQALSRDRAVGNRRSEGIALGNLGNLHAARGHLDEALSCYEAALAIHRERGNRRSEGVALANLASVLRERGRFAEARDGLERALALHREVGNRVQEGATLGKLGTLLGEVGQAAEAWGFHERALAAHRAVGNRRDEGVALGNLGTLAFEDGRVEQARQLLAAAAALHRELRFPYGLTYWLRTLARLEAAAGSDGWRALADEAVEVAAPFQALRAETLAIRARLRVEAGDLAGARADVDAARGARVAGAVAAVIALADAVVLRAEGRDPGGALREVEGVVAGGAPGSPLARELARVREGGVGG